MPERILVVRLGAMGDIIHVLPAVATVRRSFPRARITWLVEPRWRTLLEGNRAVDEIAEFDRKGGLPGMWASSRALRGHDFDLGIDFQGLIKSAGAMRLAGPPVRWGRGNPRETPARYLYTNTALIDDGTHIVEQHLRLAEAAGARVRDVSFAVPACSPEGTLPEGRFVLASPLAGWTSKQWPIEYYGELARLLAMPLVLNLPPGQELPAAVRERVTVHESGIPGLIDATRRAAAVVGVDSGPLHLAAALGKPGVAIFGPTDPARNGPYGGSLRVIRRADAVTNWKREDTYAESMRAVTPGEVAAALRDAILV